ncbi:MAG: hypothetical protein WBP85_08930 [Terracidiphilus sp.]
MEILRVHAEAYTKAVYAVALINYQIEAQQDFRSDPLLVARIHAHLSELLPHCDDLPNTCAQVKRVIEWIENLNSTAHWEQPKLVFLTAIAEIRSRLDDELAARLFFGLPSGRAKYFSDAREGWKEVIERFPETVGDIEEMSKCFALSRYPGAVFHSLLIVECGVLHLGAYIEVTDPKRGWDATCRKLKALVDGGRNTLPPKLACHFEFLEQVNQCIQTMKHAWRNKVNHVEGKLAVLRSEFTPDISEEIMMASRAFMRRLATEMPE